MDVRGDCSRGPRPPLALLALTAALAFWGLTCEAGYFEAETDSSVEPPDCTSGTTKCQDNAVMACRVDSNGVAKWVLKRTCTAGFQVCRLTNNGAICENLPSCTDGKKNQGETDIDCGGPACLPCGDFKRCVSDKDCRSKVCIKGVCRPCRAGTYSCLGNLLRVCNDDNLSWRTVRTCNPNNYEHCDVQRQDCVRLTPQGSPTPTGTYYLFGYFEQGSSEFKGGYDVDGYEDLLYVNRSTQLDVYRVTLADTDVDGKHEPNQHPENKDNPGPMEERILKFVKTYTNVKLGQPSVAEIFAEKDRIYFLRRDGSYENIYEFIFATGQTNLVMQNNIRLSCIGYDDNKKQWYGAYNSANRVVFAHYPKGNGFAAQFWYPDLAGSHLDGIEVVTDPKTKRSYVYVSDMTSDFLAQYYLDPLTGKWVQKNVFEYKETKNQYVEGMGFGAFQHFWATSGRALYEVGGGDLQKYVGVK
jgi:hypothetical protein